MKQPKLIMNIVMGAILAGILIYFGVYLFRSYQGGVTTVMAYVDRADTGLTATGILVREEQILSSGAAAGRTAELIPAEGEKVAAGAPVAILYASASGLEDREEIRVLEAEIEQLEYVLTAADSPGDAARLDAQVLDAVIALRAGAAAGDLSALADDALELRTLVFKRDFTYGDFTADDIAALIGEKRGRLDALRAALGAVSTTVYAPASGAFSAMADGLESALSPVVLDWVSPSQLRMMEGQRTPVDSSVVGKLITSATWYFAAAVPQDQAAGLTVGAVYPVLFSRDWSGEAAMTLERISDPEEGEVLLVFSCRTDLAHITQLRRQTVEVVTATVSGLRIPSQALRAVTETVTNEETGAEEEVQTLGVYVLVGRTSEFKPVSILFQGEDYFLVEPVVTGTTDRAEAERLRAGDEIILSTAGLYDGKVVR